MKRYVNGQWIEQSFITNNPNMVGATATASGTAGLVPAPASGKQNNFLRGDGTWSEVPTYPLATTSRDGLLSAEDKQKLDTISSDAASVKFIVYS